MTYTPERALPTQVAHPWRAALRTAVAVLIALSVVAPIIWAIVAEELAKAGVIIPPAAAGTVAFGIGLLTAAAAIVTRVMAIEQVSDWLTALGVGPTPKATD